MMKIENITPIIRLIVILFFLTVLAVTGNAYAVSASPVAVITNSKGEIEAKTANAPTWSSVGVLTDLSENQLVKLSKGSSVKIVFYNDNHPEILNGPCIARITTDKCILEKGDKNSLKASTPYKGIKTIRSIKLSGEDYAGVSTRNKPGNIKLLTPMEISADKAPIFEWQPVSGTEKYLISIENRDGELIWRDHSGSPKIRSKPLEYGGVYFWDIKALKNDEIIAHGSGAFKIIQEKLYEEFNNLKQDTEKQNKANPGDPTPQILLMSFCLDNHLLDEAFEACRQIVKMKPQEKQVHYWMGRLYEIKGMEKEAESEYKKAGVK